jgi:dTDP-4-amino-4,6-dideoxygalactose transaminase
LSNVPFVDLRAQHEEVWAEIEAALRHIFDTSRFIGGDYVRNFEEEFADYVGVAEAVAVANGTDALWLALDAAGVKRGDAVITVPNTFIATVEAISRIGAKPIFVDIDLQTANMDTASLQDFLLEFCRRQDDGDTIEIAGNRRVGAILPVHLYGLPADMSPLMELAEFYGLPIVEDACQAHGAEYWFDGKWKRAGSFGVASAFSFYPGKNLGAVGDAGAVVTNNRELAKRMRQIREHGQSEKYVHVTSDGWNSRLDSIQAAVLSIKLKKLDEWTSRRRVAAAHYQEALSDLPMELPIEPVGRKHVYHLYVVRTTGRDNLRQALIERGIGVGLHYPIPLHLQKAYAFLGLTNGAFPNAELSASTLLSLPMHQALSKEHIELVFQACAEVL